LFFLNTQKQARVRARDSGQLGEECVFLKNFPKETPSGEMTYYC
jgi:hypothetical protein